MKWLIGSIAALLLGLLIYQGVRLRTERPTVTDARDRRTGTASADSALESLRDLFRSSFDYEGFRTALSQLNVYIENAAQEKPRGLNTEERATLLKGYLLDDPELAEVNRTTFTPLDAHYLNLCFLLRDALNSLRAEQLQPVDRAAAGFDWVIRQVRLREGTGDLLPPDFVLRRGWGTAHERALVYLAVLEQLGLPGCVVAFPGQPAGRFWVGALINKDIYLFDTRLGLPLPGPGGKGIATLAQLRAQPKLLQRLEVDHNYPYDVHPQDLSEADVQVGGSLSALAPRMRYLQDLLAATEAIRLAVDPVGVFKQFGAAAGPAGPVQVWNQPGSWNTPFRVTRHFLPAEEGGVDKEDRRGWAGRGLVPASYYPKFLFDTFPLGADPGDRLYLRLFALPFVAFHSQARLPRDLAQVWLPGLFEQKPEAEKRPGGLDREQKPPGAEVLEHERMPRDLVLRGRYEEATALLVTIRDELQRQKDLAQKESDLLVHVRLWCERARQEYAAYYRARNASPSRRGAAEPAAGELAKNLQELWQYARPVMVLVEAAAAEPMYRHVIYLLALTKQEQAERAQARLDQLRRSGKSLASSEIKVAQSAWKSPTTWWNALLNDPGAAEYHPSARLFLARCRLALGEPAQARSLLTDLSGRLTPLEKTARLYLARDLPSR